MPAQRRVDVAELRSAGAQVGVEQAVLSGVHTETAAGIAAAQSGWVGSSAAALSEVTARWQDISDVHTAAVGKHGGHMVGAAAQFGNSEDRNAGAVADVGATARTV
jgi:uncharacterized protein YukE